MKLTMYTNNKNQTMKNQYYVWQDEELIPAVFERLDEIFPGLQFKRHGDDWHSPLKLDGTRPGKKRSDKTHAPSKRKGWMFDADGSRRSSFVEYMAEQRGVEKHEAVKLLADAVGMKMPQGEFNAAEYAKRQRLDAILHDAQEYFSNALWTNTEAAPWREYLAGRGYTDDDIRAMNIGYLTSKAQVLVHLNGRGHDLTEIKEAVKLGSPGIGDTHRITLPYFSEGRLRGFSFRAGKGYTGGDKYLNQTGPLKGVLFALKANLKGDLILVEGQLDALTAHLRGFENVAAITGSDMTDGQLEQVGKLVGRGVRRVLLCLDNDDTGRKATDKHIDKLLDIGADVWVAEYPESIEAKDPADVLMKEGPQVFRRMIDGCVEYWRHNLDEIATRYDVIRQDRGELTATDLHGLIEEVVQLGAKISDPTHMVKYKSQMLDNPVFAAYGINKDALLDAQDRIRAARRKNEEQKAVEKLLVEADAAKEQGNDVSTLVADGIRDIRLRYAAAAETDNFLRINTREDIANAMHGSERDVPTGFVMFSNKKRVDLELPGGALSVIAARTSHRKTSLMMNMALNIAGRPDGGDVFFFSYEEAQEVILAKMLNIYANIPRLQDTGNLKYIIDFLKKEGAGFGNNEFHHKADEFFAMLKEGRVRVHYSTLRAPDLCAAIEAISRKARPSAVFIDYIQLLRSPGNWGGQKYLELQDVCERLRETAIRTGLPIVLGAQFNRKVTQESEIDSGQIREAGDIEQTASLVLGLWDRQFTRPGHKTRVGIEAQQSNHLFAEVLKGRSIGVGARAEWPYIGETWKIRGGLTEEEEVESLNGQPF